MSMIKCPKCNGDISDKSEKCIHCGHPLVSDEKIFCEECGTEIKNNESVCSNCGCPINTKKEPNEPQLVEVTKVNFGSTFSMKKVIIPIVAIVSLALIIFGIVFASKYIGYQKAKKQVAEYKENLNTITFKMLDGAVYAETCGNKITKVWHNSIWKEDDSETDKYTKTNGRFNEDFNDSLYALFADEDFIELTNDVEDNQDYVNKFMKKMKNPPEEWRDAYSDLKDYYDDYLKLTNLCTNPSGSLQTYSENFNTADSDTSNGFKKMKTYLDL